MSYLVLARKYRPQKFQDVVGQQAVVRILRNALRRKRVAHAMLFSGVRGVGKTTLARIMAKALNCHHQDEDVPCDHCSSCAEIKAGNAIDLHEIDGASNRGINEIRELQENLRFLPTSERYKIVVIDEVHMLTVEAFNALLKTLEEPPPHVFFMFATTELHKVPVTILSRCQRYELRRVALNDLLDFFARIAVSEGVKITDGAMGIIAREADGSVRDGLSLLEQIFSFGGESISEDDLTQVLGLVDGRVFNRLAASLLAGDTGQALTLLAECYGHGMNMKRFSFGLLQYLRGLMICKTCRNPTELLDVSDDEITVLQALAGKYSIETITNIFNIVFGGVDEVGRSSYPRMALEMLFVKAGQAGGVVPLAGLLGRLDSMLAAEPRPAAAEIIPAENSGVPPQLKAESEAVPPVAEVVKINPAPLEPVQEPVIAAGEDIDFGGAGNRAEQDSESAPPGPEKEAAPPPPQQLEPVREISPPSMPLERNWLGFIGHVKERKRWMASALQLAEKVDERAGELVIKFDDPAECLILQDVDNLKLLTEFAQDFFQKELMVKVTAAGSNGEDDELDKPMEERRALTRDPVVEMVVDTLGGEVSGVRTGPRSR
ncbi:DNA polymerase III subunits gamma and tau [hydrothermal vent metagenome]|uniref:DNA-directed DNA polymerase n=1 Tax=hydrothermal vent metagenome TaxID=652676 RepID=A0A3B0WCP1_9ZZZZ